MPLVDKIRGWFSGAQSIDNVNGPTPATATPAIDAAPTEKRQAAWVRIGAPLLQKKPDIIAVAEDNILTQALDANEGISELPEDAPQSPYDDAFNALQTATTMEERSSVLLSHSFFIEGAGKDKSGFDAKMMAAILEHLNDVYSTLGYLLRDRGHPSMHSPKPDMYPQSWNIRRWLEIQHGHGWIERAIELARQEPAYKDALQQQVHKLFETWCRKDHEAAWPKVADLVLSYWSSVPPTVVMNGFYNTFKRHTNVNQLLLDYPSLSAFWENSRHDAEWLNWCASADEQGLWLMQIHPRIDAWDLSEKYAQRSTGDYAEDQIKTLANKDKSGALLKAWYGYELTAEEITKHPLAHSLYVHKHAPMYLEEVQPLPDSWSVALTLSQTGREFCDMLVMTAKAKMSKEPVLTMKLPDLGHEPTSPY